MSAIGRDGHEDGFTVHSAKTKATMSNSTTYRLTASDIGSRIQVRAKNNFSAAVTPSAEKSMPMLPLMFCLLIDNNNVFGNALSDPPHSNN